MAEALLPGFGIPLCVVELEASVFVVPPLPPLGIRLAILEARLGSASVAPPLVPFSFLWPSDSLVSPRSGTEVRLELSLALSLSLARSLSFSAPFVELFLAVSARLNVLWAMPFSAIFGLLVVTLTGGDPAVPLTGRALPSASSRSRSVLEPDSTRSTTIPESLKAPPLLPLSLDDPVPDGVCWVVAVDDLEPPLLLKSFNFSSMDLWVAALAGTSDINAVCLDVPLEALLCCVVMLALLVIDVLSCLTESALVEEAVCLELVDLLLQGFPVELGCGMAEEDEEEEDEELRGPDVGARSVMPDDSKVTPSDESLAKAETGLGLDLSLKPWLRRLPVALMEPRGEQSLPPEDTLDVGPGSRDCISAWAFCAWREP